jgi:S1-C subfamily serine protease
MVRTSPVRFGPFAVVALTACCASRPAGGMDLVELVKKVEPSIVQIETDKGGGVTGLGSGVVVDDRGIVVTNFHVAEGAKKAKLIFRSGESMEVLGFLAAEPGRDLALLKTDPFKKPLAMKLAEELPSVGEKVAAFGNPHGFSFTTSEGIISAVRPASELKVILGADAFSYMGYAEDSTWLQSTAPISPGNSGGPLVNMKAEVVGLNTWVRTDGQNLNFAISAKDIQLVVKKYSEASMKDLAKLPHRRAKAVPRDPSVPTKPEEFKVALPTGRVFSLAIFDTRAVESTFRVKGDNVVVLKHPSGTVFAVASQKAGKLDGLAVARYENKEPMTCAMYLDGKRHGILKTWDEAGNLVLLAQYLKGKRHGFFCYFEDAILRMLIEYENDEPKWVQLMSDITVLNGFGSRADAEKDTTARELFGSLDKCEATLKTNELAFKKQVVEFDRQIRSMRAAKLSGIKRDEAQRRFDQQAAENAALAQELFRRAMTGR